MLNIPSELKTIYENDILPLVPVNAIKDLEIYFPALNLTIATDQVEDESFSLEESLFSDSNMIFGSCEAAEIKFTLADVEQDLKGLEFTIKQHIDGYILPLGTYTVDSCVKQDNLRFKDIVAYDSMVKSDINVADWYNALTFPLTLKQFRSSLLSHLGIAEEIKELPNDNMLVTKTIEPTKIRGRDVLFCIQELNGCFGHINRHNKFTHVILEPSYGLYPMLTLLPGNDVFPVSATDTDYFQDGSESVYINQPMYAQVRFEEFTTKEITKLQVREEEGDVGAIVGTGSNLYVIEGNFLVYGKSASELNTIAINAFGNMQKRPYRPFNSENIGLPYIEVGDTVAFETDDKISSYVFKRTLKGIQALRDSFSAEGNEEIEQDFSLNKEILQLQGKSNVLVRNVEELSNTIADVEEGLQSQITQTAGEIRLEISNTEEGLQSQITQTANKIELKVDANGIINAINLSDEGIKIDTSKLDVTGFVTFNALESPGQTTIHGDNLKTGTVVADTVRASWVYAGTVSGDKIVGGTITGVDISSPSSQGNLRLYNGMITSTYGTQNIVISAAGLILSVGGITNASISQGGIYGKNVGGDAGDITTFRCNTINGYTPIHSGNISQQSIGYANNAGYASSASYASDAGELGGSVYVSGNSNMRPRQDGGMSCGTSGGRWSSLWAVSGTIQTSDIRKKLNIKALDDRFLQFAKLIMPYTYQMLEGTSGRYHIGFIAQEIEKAMNSCGISDMEFAGLIKDPVYKHVLENGDYDTSSEIIDHDYFLRYDEFIPLIFLYLSDINNKLMEGL